MNIVFNASAGTGKTYQVTHLYAALVLGRPHRVTDAGGKTVALYEPDKDSKGIDPRHILLITFTDNAAAELRNRITGLMTAARREAEARGDAAEADAAMSCLMALPQAPISTIHAFCAGLLRTHSLEAGLSPAFSVLAADAASQLLAEIIHDELIRRLDPGGPEYDGDLAGLCAGMRILKADRGVSLMDTAQGLIHQAAGKGIALATEGPAIADAEARITVDEFKHVQAALTGFAERNGGLPPVAGRVYEALTSLLNRFPARPSSPTDADETLSRLVTELNAVATGGFRGRGLEEISARFRSLKEGVRERAAYLPHRAEMDAFLRFAVRVASAYHATKQERDCLDFDDLLLKTRDLLLPAPKLAAPGHTYDYVIVDEVQDTSRIQCEIIESLWSPESNGLVICGDPKQSIYGWRDADPLVMPELQERIAGAAVHRSVPLCISHRSKDAILDFINPLFERVYEGAYREPLLPQPNALVRAQGEGPCVEVLRAPWEDAAEEDVPGRDERLNAEMMAVAQRIRLLVTNDAAWRPRYRYSDEAHAFAPAAAGNQFRYSDVLILMRRRTELQALEHALRRYQIPYVLGGKGNGLFSRHEVKDVLLFLKTLVDPSDAIALVGFLRSPWVGLSDETITRLAWTGSGFDANGFCDAALGRNSPSLCPLEPAERARLARARELVTSFRAEAHLRLASEMVRRLVSRTGYDAVLAGTFRGGQRVANLRRAIEWLRENEQGGTVQLADVVARLEECLDDPPDMPEAALLDPDQNVVSVMTVHGAKGLTSRVVVIPDICAMPRSDNGWAIAERGRDRSPRLHLRMNDVEGNAISTPGFEEARDISQAVRETEDKNLFYVAMTRARDLIVVSGSPRERATRGWRFWLDEAMEANPAAAALIRSIRYPQLSEACPGMALAAASGLPAARSFDKLSGLLPARRLECLVMRYTATALCRTALSPRPSGTLRYGAPADDAEPTAPGADRFDDDDDSTVAIGTAGHAVLAQLARENGLGAITRLMDSLSECEAMPKPEKDGLATRLVKAQQWLSSRLARARAGTVGVEQPFAMTIESQGKSLIVDGVIDLLFQDLDGVWRVWDYKFVDNTRKLAAQYGLQLGLYAEAVRRWQVSGGPVEAAILAVGADRVTEIPIPADPATCRTRAMEAAEARLEL